MEGCEYMLAPMEDYTDAKLRKKCFEYGADSTFTEMARLSALARGNKSTFQKIQIPEPIPTYIQLIGSKEKELTKFLQSFTAQDGFLGFNLNLGCASPNMVRIGLGCAMIKRIAKVKKLVKIIREKNFPVSIKLRLGMNGYEKDKKVYLNLINEVDADFFVVHARHGKEPYNRPADFSVYPDCVNTNKKIIANGDIKTKEQIKQLTSIGIKGVMIGREAVNDPHIFSELKD